MGILSPHAEHGPTKPELRIGNLVVPGKLVKLPKPLLVLTTRKLDSTATTAGGAVKEDTEMTAVDDKKRRRDEAGTAAREKARGYRKPCGRTL